MSIDRWIVARLVRLLIRRYSLAYHELEYSFLAGKLAGCGKHIFLQPHVRFRYPQHIHLGSHIAIGENTILRGQGGITIEDFVLIADNVTIVTSTHQIDTLHMVYSYRQSVTIKANVWIGAGAIILPGVTIGENSVIAAGAVVTKNIPANSLAQGIPAKVTRSLEIDLEELEQLKRNIRADPKNPGVKLFSVPT